jgi:hypothetical protein
MDIPVVTTRISADGRVWVLTASGAWDVVGFAAELDPAVRAKAARLIDRATIRHESRRYTEAARLEREAEALVQIRWIV